jgi:hypothetical protein
MVVFGQRADVAFAMTRATGRAEEDYLMSESLTQRVKRGGDATPNRGTAGDPAREAARAAMRRAGGNVLGAAVDRTVSRIEGDPLSAPVVARARTGPAAMGEATEDLAPRVPARQLHRGQDVPMGRSHESPTEQIKASLRKLLARLLERGFGIPLDAVERLGRTFDVIGARGGVKVNALLGGARAGVGGRSAVWGRSRVRSRR